MWDAFLQCSHLDSSSNRIQRNYKGLKITACMCSWGKLWTRYKKAKTQLPPLEEPGAKAGYCACALLTVPLSHPSGWLTDLPPTLIPFKEPARPCWASKQGNLLLVFTPSRYSLAWISCLVSFINFSWLKNARIQISNLTKVRLVLYNFFTRKN